MKRCIICGKAAEENSIICSECGGEIVDVKDSTADDMELQEEEADSRKAAVEKMSGELDQKLVQNETEEKIGTEEPVQELSEEATESEGSEHTEHPGVPRQENRQVQEQPIRQPRRMKSGPQIYGQTGMTEEDQAAYYAQQGMIRRNMQGQPVNRAQGRPMQGQPMNGAQGRPMQGQPMNGAQGRPMQGQPMNGMPQGRPMQGQPMNGMPQGRPMQGQPMNGVPQARPMNGGAGRYAGQIMDTARKALKSPIFFLIAVLHTMYVGGAIGAIFMQQLNYSQVARLISGMNFPQQVTGYMTQLLELMTKLDSGAVGVNLVLHVPDMLFCLGLWLVFLTAITAKENMSGIGFLLMKVIIVVNMILYCIVMLAGLIISVTLVVAAWASGIQSMKIAAVVTIVFMVVITMMVIMYYFCYLATITTLRVNSNTGEIYGTVSAYVAVIHILMAIPAVINLLSGIVNAEIANIIGAVGQIGWLLLFGIWVIRYRGKMSEFED